MFTAESREFSEGEFFGIRAGRFGSEVSLLSLSPLCVLCDLCGEIPRFRFVVSQHSRFPPALGAS